MEKVKGNEASSKISAFLKDGIIDRQRQEIRLKDSKIGHLRAARARWPGQEASSESQLAIANSKKEIQPLTSDKQAVEEELQVEKTRRQEDRSFTKSKYEKILQELDLFRQGQRADQTVVQEMNQYLRETSRAEQELSKTMMQRDRAVLRLRRVQRNREDDQFISHTRCAQLRQEKDEAIRARDQAEWREDLDARKMTVALQERDEALQKKKIESLQQEQQGRRSGKGQSDAGEQRGPARERPHRAAARVMPSREGSSLEQRL